MTRTGTIVKVMQAVLLVTVLTPATVYADPLSTRQMLAQAETQSQDQTVKGEVKRINRGLILGTAEAATNSSALRPVEIPAISAPAAAVPTTPAPVTASDAPKVEIPAPPIAKVETAASATSSSYETAAAPTNANETPNSIDCDTPGACSVCDRYFRAGDLECVDTRWRGNADCCRSDCTRRRCADARGRCTADHRECRNGQG